MSVSRRMGVLQRFNHDWGDTAKTFAAATPDAAVERPTSKPVPPAVFLEAAGGPCCNPPQS
ncbi:MAG: hypothetical protein ACYCSP_01045 [Acidobacteriaceae bacterium]